MWLSPLLKYIKLLNTSEKHSDIGYCAGPRWNICWEFFFCNILKLMVWLLLGEGQERWWQSQLCLLARHMSQFIINHIKRKLSVKCQPKKNKNSVKWQLSKEEEYSRCFHVQFTFEKQVWLESYSSNSWNSQKRIQKMFQSFEHGNGLLVLHEL